MLIPIREAMKQLGLDRSTPWRWGKKGKIKEHQDHRGWRFYEDEQIRQILKKRPASLFSSGRGNKQ